MPGGAELRDGEGGRGGRARAGTATDDCGNSSTATQTINVDDSIAPVIAALPAESTIECPAVPSFATAKGAAEGERAPGRRPTTAATAARPPRPSTSMTASPR